LETSHKGEATPLASRKHSRSSNLLSPDPIQQKEVKNNKGPINPLDISITVFFKN